MIHHARYPGSPAAIRVAAALPVLLMLAVLAVGSPPPQSGNFDDLPGTGPVKKTPGFFHRPSKDTPAEQLEYAAALEARGKLKRACGEYRALVHEWHGSPQAVTAQLALARVLAEREKYIPAFEEYQYLIDRFSGRFPYEKVLEAQFRIANHLRTRTYWDILGLPGYKEPRRALPMLEKIVENGPGWDKTPEAQYYIGLIHEEENNLDEAVVEYRKLMQKYPKTRWAREAAFARAQCLYRTARRYRRDEELCRRALAALASFIADYPASSGIRRAESCRDTLNKRLAQMYFDKAVFYEEKSRRPESALVVYRNFKRRFPLSDLAKTAAERIRVLEKKYEEKN
ncbi:MAG: tetratricopeptide repeat protein [Kiritimatiellia bacterium]